MSQDNLPRNINMREVRIDADGRLLGSSKSHSTREVRIGPDGRIIRVPKQATEVAQQAAPVKPTLSPEEQQKILADNSGPSVADQLVQAQTTTEPEAVASSAPLAPVVAPAAEAPAATETVAAATGVADATSTDVGDVAGQAAMASSASASTPMAVSASSSSSSGWLPALGGIGLLALAGGGGGGSSSSAISAVSTLLSGSVVDGYIHGAQIYVDLNDNGLAEAGENTGLVTNQSGQYSGTTSLNTNGHAILAVGGVDTATGLRNAFVVLKAPIGSTVINPLTTLVQSYMDTHSGVSATAAATAVANALGLVGVNLLTYNPLANSDATALAVQKVAVQIATIATIAADDAGNNALTTSNAVLDNLANAITSGSSLNLTNATLLTNVLAGSGVVSSAASLAATMSTANSTIAATTSIDAITTTQIQYASKAADTIAPTTPDTPDLIASSDTGSSTTDNVTTDVTPTVRIGLNVMNTDGTAVVPGDILNVYVNGVLGAPNYTLTATDISNQYADVTLTTLAAGSYSITAKLTDQVGNAGWASSALGITIETSAPPQLMSVSPLDNATEVPVTSNIVLTFDKAIQAGTGNIVISDGTNSQLIPISGDWFGQVLISGNTLTINPMWDLTVGRTYSVQMASGVITDVAGNAFAGINDATTLNFTTGVDTTAPTLSSSNPADNATAVAVGDNIVLTFSEAIKVGTGNIVISNGTDTQTIPVTDSTFNQVSVAGNVVTINPLWTLQLDSTYSVKIESGAFTDLSGNAYAGISDTTTLNFTTGTDTTAPTLTGSTPADNASAVVVGSNIVLTFSEAVKLGTGNIVISNGTDTQTIPVTDTTFNQVTVNGNVVTINPLWDLQQGATYYVQMASGVITDLVGNSYAGISDTSTLNFTTQDSIAPTLQSSTPADNATAVVVDSAIVLTFNEAVQAGTGNIVISDGASDTRTISVTDSSQVTISGTTVTINPTANLNPSSSYSVQLASGVIKDLAGNAYAGITDATTLNFATSTVSDVTAPTLVSSSPADGATAVAVGNNIVLTFSEAVKLGTGNIVISNGTDTQTIPVTDTTFNQVSVSGHVVTINPLWDLQQGATYSVQMASGVITDLVGNSYAGISDTSTLNFTTQDSTAPTLKSSNPADNATAVVVGSDIVLTFNEAVQAGTGNIVISDGASDTRTISVTDSSQVTISGTTVTINPTADLNLSSSYSIQLASGVIKDLAGNAYAGITDATTLNFATPDIAAPTLISSLPADDATAVAVGNNIVLTFSEAVKIGTGNIIISDGTDTQTIPVTDTTFNQVTVNGHVVTINPLWDLKLGNTYSVKIESGAFTDLSGNAYAGISDTTTLNFTTGTDSTTPTLLSAVPADNATAVALADNIVLTFSEQIKLGSGFILLSDGDKDVRAIDVNNHWGQLSVNNNVLTINPSNNLNSNTTYFVQMASGVILDTSSNAYAGIADTTTLNFTTLDTTAPLLVSSTPADEAIAVALDSSIVLTFNEAVQLGQGNITIGNGSDVRTISVTDTSQVSVSGNSVTINPTNDFISGTYSVQVASGAILDTVGNAYAGISDSILLNFSVNDVTAPTLLSSTPADNAVGIVVDGKIVLTFSEAIKAGTGNIVISNGSDTQTIPINDVFGQVVINNNVLTIDPLWNLQINSTYSVQMASGVITDLSGNAYAGMTDTTTLNFSTPDYLAPTLASSTPADNLIGVAIANDIVLTFNEQVKAGTGNIVISNGAGDTRTISVTDSSQVTINGTTVTINPTADLALNTSYSVTMANGVITDLSGNAYVGITDTATLNFTTLDPDAPTLTSASPADETTAVLVGSNIVLTFSEAVKLGTGNIVISSGTDTQTIPVTDTTFNQVTVNGNVVTINPLWDLQPNSTYSVQMASGVITDLAGHAYLGINDKTTLNFSTTDTQGPTLVSSTPADNSVSIAVGNNIVLTFNEAVKAGTGNIVISDGASDTRTISVSDTSQVTISGTTVTINPTSDLNANAHYHVQMVSGVLTDLVGNAYAGINDATTLNFSTTDTLAPNLSSSLPADNATAVAVGNNIVLTFNEAVQVGTGNIVISDGASDVRTISVTDSWQVSISGHVLTINPLADLTVGSTYSVQMASGVIKDLAGNAYAGISDATTLNFTAGVDTTAPTLTTATPANGTSAVLVGSNIVLTFNEQIKAGTGDIVISNGTDTQTIPMGDGFGQTSINGNVLTINPLWDLQANSTYSVRIAAGAITDTSGNAYAGINDTVSLSFSTQDTLGPSLSSSTPADNATAVALDGNIVLTFNEAVKAGTGNIVISNGVDIRTISVSDVGQVTISGNTVTINPTADLINGSYSVQMASGVITDASGNAYAGISDATTLNFMVNDVTAPTLLSSTPVDNAIGVTITDNIVLTFSEAIQAGTGNIVISNGSDTQTIPIGDVFGQTSISGNVLTINPMWELQQNSTYYVQMASGVIKDVVGNPYAGITDTTTLSFSTTDTIVPTLVSSAPADGASNVAVGSNIVLTFSEAVKAGTGNIVISNGDDDTRTIKVSDAGQVTFDGATVTINPTLNLGQGHYYVQMASGVITDLGGNAYAGISDTTTLNFSTPDPIAPTLVSSVPGDNATAVAVGNNIILTFNEAMQIGTGNIVISNGSDTRTIAVTADSWEVSVSGKVVTINPFFDLETGTTYNVQMASGVLQDLAGNPYAGISDSTTLSFTTGTDTTAPTLSSSNPTDNATAIAVGKSIVLTFNEQVKAGTGNIVISDGASDTRTINLDGSTWYVGSVTFSGNIVTIDPLFDLKPNTSYSVQMAAGVILDTSGNAYAGITDASTLNFITVDTVAPTLLSSSPADDTTGVLENTDIGLIFNESVKAGTGNIVVSNGTNTYSFDVNDASQVTIAGDKVLINPTTNLLKGNYSVQMASGVLTDLEGNAYAGIADATTLNFTVIDTTAPTLSSSSPADNATAVAVGSNIVLTFTEAMQAGTGNIVISNGTDTRTISVTDSSQVAISGTTVTINPTLNLQTDTTYYVQMASGVLTDTSGNAYAGISDTTSLNFATLDTIAPTLQSSSPTDNATAVLEGSNIVLIFSETVQAGTGNIVISDGAGDTRTISVSDATQVTIAGNLVTINLTLDLHSNTAYSVQLASGVLLDTAGNAYAGITDATTLNFSVGDTLAPTLLSSTPTDDAKAVVIGNDLVLTFSEAIQAGVGSIVINDGVSDTRTISITDASQVTINGNTVTINPTADLNNNTTYYVQLASGVIKDLAGNAYAGINDTTTLNFSTPDTLAPTLSASTPADNATVVVENSNIVLTFNETVQAGTGNIVISDGASDIRTISITDATQVTISGNVVTINPTSNLSSSTLYSVQMASGVLTDQVGNAYAGITDATTLNFTTDDTVTPTLVSSAPADNTVAVSISDNITLTFSEDVLIGIGNILISNGAGDVRTIAVTDATQVSVSGKVVTIDPTSDLNPDTAYFIRIDAGAVTDLVGNAYAGISSNHTLNFSTQDTVDPTLLSSSPTDNAFLNTLNNNIVLTFSEVIQAGTGDIVISDGAGDTRTISITDATQVTISDKTVTINPTDDLVANKNYYVQIAAGVIEDLQGNAYAGISDTTTLNFTTDTLAPTLSSSTPLDNATAVAIGNNVVLTFSEDVKAGTGNIFISDGVSDTRVIAIGDASQVTISGNTVTINPTADLNANSSYSVQMANGVITDQAGNAYAGLNDAISLNFATVDTIAPTLMSSTPADNATGIVIGSNIVLTFSEAVQAGVGNIVISNGAGDTRTIAVGDTSQVTISGSTVTINPAADLNIDSTYNVQMASGVLKDLANNAFAGISNATTLNFSTTDTLAPVLSSSSPADNASGIAKSANIVLTFNEDIKAGTGMIVISNSVDDSRVIDVNDASQVTISGKTLTINPSLDLQSSNGATSQVYNVQMAAGTVTDLFDNAYAGITDATSLNFTIADSVAPTLSSTTPADDATAVAIGNNIVLTFSEAVQAGTGNIVISDGASDTRTIAVGDAQVTISGNTVTINPTVNLNANSSYSVQMASGVITDTSGNAYAGISDTTSLSFKTADTIAPTLLSSTPADNATQVLVDGNIVLTFSETVQAGAGNIVISDGAGDTRTIAISDGTQVAFNGSTVTINPTLDLATDKTYYVQMASGVIKDLENNNYAGIADTTSLNFTTSDTIAPTLTGSTPADDTLSVNESANIVLTFSETVQAGSGNIVISNGAGDTRTIAVTDVSQVTFSGNTMTINPTADLKSSSAYNVKMASGVIVDVNGNAYAGIASAATLNFNTTDTVAPTLSSSSPADDVTQVAVGSNIVLTFNENVQAGSGNIIISDGAGDTRTIAVTDTSQVSFYDNVVTINPSVDLNINRTYNVQMASGVITDYTGNAYVGIATATTLNFNTPDTLAPTLSSSTPADNARISTVGSNIVLTFNEAVKAGTGNIVITNGTDTRTISVTDSSQVTFNGTAVVTINPTADLISGDYYVTMDSGVITDLVGNAYAGISNSTTLNFTLDVVAPTLSSSTPADNASNVVKSSNIVLTFSEAMKAGTGNIILTNAADGADTRTIAVTDTGLVSFSGNTVTINPAFDLLSSGLYSVTMASGVLQDEAGNAYAGISDSTTLNFTVADTVAPTLSSASPADGATAVVVSSNIVLTFNEAVKAGSGSILISDGDGDTRTISVTDNAQVSFSGSTMTINPSSNLNTDRTYYVQFASGVVTDLAGNAFAGILSTTELNFSTPDTIVPTLLSSTPADNATGVAGGNNIVLTFSEAIQAGTGNIVISNGTDPWKDDIRTISITDASQVTMSGNTVTINPSSDLLSKQHYTVKMGSGVVKDLAGNSYAGLVTDTALDFTVLDTTAPLLDVTLSTPSSGSYTYSRTGEIILVFDETIQLGTSGTIEIHNYFGTDSVKKSYNLANPNAAGATITVANGNEVHLSAPGTALAADTKYYFTISTGAIKDTAGNSLVAITTTDYNKLAFTTSSDTTAPTLASSTPADNATEVPIGNSIVLTFNENIKAGTGNIVLKNSSNDADSRTIAIGDATQITIDGATVTINPTADLVGGDSYYVTMASGVILDIANNAYAGISSATTLNFTTLDTTPPTLASSSPADEGVAVAVGANITLTFSENVAKGTAGYIQLTGSDGDIRMIDVTSAQVTVSNKVVTINPTANLHADTTYTLQMDAGAIKDTVGNAHAGISSTSVLNFSTASNATNIATYGTVNGTTALVPELLGTSGADTTSGGLVGGTVDNTLTGGMGADILTGNAGKDVFIVAIGYHPDATAMNNAKTALDADKADGDADSFVGSDDTMPIDENLVADHSAIAANRKALEDQHTKDNDVKNERIALNLNVWWWSTEGPGKDDPQREQKYNDAVNALNLHKAIYGEDAAVNQKEADSKAALDADIADHGSTAAINNRVTLEGNYKTAKDAYDATSVVSHSTLANMDQMTDFAAGTDSLHLLDHNGANLTSPTGVVRVGDIASSDDLTAALQTAFSGVITANSAGIVQINAGTAAGTYLYINDATATYDTTADIFVKMTGMTGLGGDGVGVDGLTLTDYFSDTVMTGTVGDDTLVGSALNNQLKGDLGADTLTGGGGQDVFVEAFGVAGGTPKAPSSTVASMDHITDFKVGADTIHLTSSAGLDVDAPTALTRVADVASSDDLAAALQGAFDGVIGANAAGIVVINAGAAAGTYLYANDATAAYDTATDVFVNLTGITGLEAAGSLTVSHYIV